MDRSAALEPTLENDLPYSKEAEQSVLGAIIADSSCLGEVLEYLKPESFYNSYNREIFSVLMRMYLASEKIDVVTLLDRVAGEGIFPTESDARVYLVSLVEMVPTTANVADYARIVQEKYYLRSLVAASQKILSTVGRAPVMPRASWTWPSRISSTSARAGRPGASPRSTRSSSRPMTASRSSRGGPQRVYGDPVGLRCAGYHPHRPQQVGSDPGSGPPGMGKTAFALNIAANVAVRAQKKVAIFSLEMSKEQLVGRILSSEALIQSGALRTGNLSPEDWTKLAMTAQMLSKAEMYIDDTPSITVADIKAKLRRLPDVGLVIIDYLQLMTSGRRSSENRVLEVSEITRSLKIMAKELNVPVITLSQLSRGPDSRTDHRPMLSDLRESGSIEQDADIVLFLYRDAYYNRESEEQNIAECIVAKNRHGETDSVKLGWDGQFTRFKGLELFRNEG